MRKIQFEIFLVIFLFTFSCKPKNENNLEENEKLKENDNKVKKSPNDEKTEKNRKY